HGRSARGGSSGAPVDNAVPHDPARQPPRGWAAGLFFAPCKANASPSRSRRGATFAQAIFILAPPSRSGTLATDMSTYIVFFRAINVGGRNKLSMDTLVGM